MAVSVDEDSVPQTRPTGRETMEYRLVYLIGFTAFLGVALIRRALPWNWTVFGGRGGAGRSILEEARVRADGTVPFAFMR